MVVPSTCLPRPLGGCPCSEAGSEKGLPFALAINRAVVNQNKDLLDEARYTWRGEWNYVKLDPMERVAHIFVIRGT